MTSILALAASEFRIALRNRWVAIAIVMMTLFAVVLTVAGTAATGTLGVDRLTVTVASLISLGVYLLPLLALLLSFDAVAGECERGTLALMLTYPVGRAEILAGKFIAHLGILALAATIGFGTAAAIALIADPEASVGLPALFRLFWTAPVLGAAFLGIGYALSAVARRPGAAAGLAIAVWLVVVVLYDIALLAAIVTDGGGTFTVDFFPWLLAANPADAFRLFNLAASEATALASGVDGAAASMPPAATLVAILAWPLLALAFAHLVFRRVTP
ncbi:ABC transporter permease [Oceanibacterium hippocampi]|uniref:ABC-2 family transporter protein n=1 Tax=Oceanibacterium hippocampi TaxID=745714 RepID=A0A1Y5TD71_9PROT|nr:ABC transporter permease subunit [Oceanibacterium hippocampi]SLN61035.1 ABC-2 family transporter protein [Oceanibacterium hippocampi]